MFMSKNRHEKEKKIKEKKWKNKRSTSKRNRSKVSCKKMFLKISKISQTNTCAIVFLIKLEVSASNFIKKGFGTGVFL